MASGRLLLAIARAFCSARVCERILEPLIADFQHRHAACGSRRERLELVARTQLAFWQAVALCGIHSLADRALRFPDWLLTGPHRSRLLEWSVGIAALFALGWLGDWVRTGTGNAGEGVAVVARAATYLPGIVAAHYWPPRTRFGRGAYLAAYGALMAAVWWLSPFGLGTGAAGMNLAYLLTVMTARRFRAS